MEKIIPIKTISMEESKKTYDALFANIQYYIETKLKARGIHDLIADIYREKIKNSDILDIGCGLGRFSFISAKSAKHVVGLDMTEKAISCAKVMQNALNINNIDFILSTIEDFQTDKKFDFILLSGTLEHIIDVDNFFEKIRTLMKPSSIFITDSPSEFNFRGVFHASLWKLFNFPMTLTDVRIVTPKFINEMCERYDLKLKRTVGTLYSRGWGNAAEKDLKERIPNVLKDIEEKTKKINISINNYNEWLEEASEIFEKLLRRWEKEKLISKISNKRSFNFSLEDQIIIKNKLPLDTIKDYLSPDFTIDPYYSEDEQISLLGGNIIYEIYKREK